MMSWATPPGVFPWVFPGGFVSVEFDILMT